MSYRYLRIIVFFDLPTETLQDKREYRRFRKYLLKKGFIMLQESVYCRMVLNATVQGQLISDLHRNRPASGVVQILSVTEKQFSRMEYLVGSYSGDIINNDKRLIVL